MSNFLEVDETFAGTELNRDLWFPYYLPHWSSRAESAATYDLAAGELRLSIPEEQGLWCPDVHPEPLRVSCIQTGNFSGPVGSTIGPQPIGESSIVSEEQAPFWGYTPLYGEIEVRMRGNISPRSMFAFWMSGIEDEPHRSGEICVAEIFGEGISNGWAEVGMGIHRFRDPDLIEEFSPIPLVLDVTQYHTYGVQWSQDDVAFSVDGQIVKQIDQSPAYPMQLMIGVFDFPARKPPGPASVPEMFVSHVTGRNLPD